MINLFSLSSLLLSITCIFLVILLAIYGRSKLQRIWMLFNISVGIWAIGAFYISQIESPKVALEVWRIVEISVVFIAIFFLHVTAIVCNLKLKRILSLAYIQGLIFSALSLTSDLFFLEVKLVFNSFYYPTAEPLFYLFFLIWMILVVYSQYKLFYTFFK